LFPGLSDQLLEAVPTDICDKLGPFSLAKYYACTMKAIPEGDAKQRGIEIGRAVAGKIITERSHDGAERPEPVWNKDFIPRQPPGDAKYPFTQWQIDPVSGFVTALGGYWGAVRPFTLNSGFQFRPSETQSPAGRVSRAPAPDKLPSYNAVYQFGRET